MIFVPALAFLAASTFPPVPTPASAGLDLPDAPTHVVRAPAPTPSGSQATLFGASAPPTGLGLPSTTGLGGGGTVLAMTGACAPFVNGGFHNGLFGWTAASAPGGGSVEVVDGEAVLSEGTAFLTTLSQPVCIPAGARTLSFELVLTGFDGSAGFIPDAFEVSLLDAGFQSAVPTWSPGATSYFNVQEDGTLLHDTNVTVDGTTISLDLLGLAEGETFLLAFDLIGADADFASNVTIDNVVVDAGGPGVAYCVGVGCPCGNDSPTSGCLNSLGRGGLLSARGTASVAADDLVLEVEGITPTFAYLFVGTSEACEFMGDGLLGLSPGPYQPDLLRLMVQEANELGELTIGPGLVSSIDAAAGATGTVLVGSTWNFQVVYRDAPSSPCDTLFNFTNALSVTFDN